MGAQARQDRGVQPPAARRHRHQLRRPRRRRRRSCRGALLHHARQRHAPAARRRARADRHHHAPAEPPGVRSAGRAASPTATASCSRASASRSRARPARCSRGSTPGHTGVDPYTTAVSDTYQDLFGEGIFTGKGLYDVDAFMAALDDSVPENALLSHDLFEGLHARVALVSDVELVDDYPVERADARAAAASLDSRRLADPVLAVSVRAVAARPEAQHAAAHRPLEDSRQPAAQPGRADAARAARRRLDVAARAALVLDDWPCWSSSRRSCCRSSARLLVGPRQAQSLPVFLRNLRDDAATALGAGRAQPDVPGLPRLRDGARDRRSRWCASSSPSGGCSSGRPRPRRAARSAGLVGRKGVCGVRRRDDGEPDHRRSSSRCSSLRCAPGALPSAAPFLLLWIVAPAVAYWLSLPVGPRARPLSDAERALPARGRRARRGATSRRS